ncbi:MAG TPA: HEAT repeat domain-containing protein [Anaerolineae bacterium]
MPPKSKFFYDFDSALKHLAGDTRLASSALNALSSATRKNLAAFARAWVLLPVERRRSVVKLMVELAEANVELDFNLLYRYLLDDEDPAVRASAIEGLWEDEDAALVKPFVGFLRSDPDARVRAAAADSLGRFMLLAEYGRLPESPHANLIFEALLATIHGTAEDLNVRRHALEAVAYSSRDQVRDVITAAYADEDPQMRASAVAAMGRSADPFWRKTAADELESLDPRMRFEAVRSVGELEYRTAVPQLIELLDDPDREVQMAVITALGQIGGSAAKQALANAAESEDEVLHELADDALQELRFSGDPNLLLFDLDVDEESGEDDDVVDEELVEDEDDADQIDAI